MGWFLLPYVTFNLFLLLTHFPSHTCSLCNRHDNSALQQFKNSLFVIVNTSSAVPTLSYDGSPLCLSLSPKTESWKNGTDCCEWDGVTCDVHSGHVTGLDIGCSNLKGVIHPNSTIFQLRHLQLLNLAFNDFSGSSIPSGIGDLGNLTHLTLSHSAIGGDIPSSISHLSKLVSLDLSVWGMRLNPYTWKKLILNATNLRKLRLDYANMSSIRESSLSLLLNLSSSLASLSLKQTGLQGYMPSDILSLPNLQELDLSYNEDLRGQLPKSNWSTPLRYLDLSDTAFSGDIPNSIGHLKSLNHLSLAECEFQGPIPPSFWNLTQLTHLDLFDNNLNGEIPDVFGKLTKLKFLSLSSNNLGGQVPPSLFHLTQLSELYLASNKLVGPIPIEITKHSTLISLSLARNMLNGTIPHWCFSLPSLSELYLHDNQLTGSVGEFSTHSMESLYLSNNKLHGDFPNSIFEFENLTDLSLSSMNLSGLVDFHQFSKVKKLVNLDLSHNSFLSIINIDSGADYILPNLQYLYLSSSNINSFPKFLARLQNLYELDLSNNKIQGEIPKWLHEKLLHSWKDIHHMDLSFNKLQGDLPILPNGIWYFIVSNNNFIL